MGEVEHYGWVADAAGLMRHLDVLDTRLGGTHVLGGQCMISVRRDEAGRIVHLNNLHLLSFGARAADQTPRALTIAGLGQAGGVPGARTDKTRVPLSQQVAGPLPAAW